MKGATSLTTQFIIQHHKSSPYHPQDNGIVEEFNKIPEIRMTKVCCVNKEYWDDIVPIFLWDYRTTTKVAQVHPISVYLRERRLCYLHSFLPLVSI
jgi:transposase InsO family protein